MVFLLADSGDVDVLKQKEGQEMIGLPGYFPAGADIHGPYDMAERTTLNQESPAALSQAERLEMERIKAEYAKRARAEEMVEIARTMEHFRTRLLAIDLTVQANLVNEVIRDLVNKWNAERG